MIGIIGRKLGMTQIFNESGQQIPCTVIEAEPNPVVQVLEKDTMGYAAVQLAHGKQAPETPTRSDARARRYQVSGQAGLSCGSMPC